MCRTECNADNQTARNPAGEETLDQGPGNPAQGPDHHPQLHDDNREHPREGPHAGLPASSHPHSELTTTRNDEKNICTRAHHDCTAYRGLHHDPSVTPYSLGPNNDFTENSKTFDIQSKDFCFQKYFS